MRAQRRSQPWATPAAICAAETLTLKVQRLLQRRTTLAPSSPKPTSPPTFKPNGETEPQNPDYLKHLATDFADFRLEIGGLVERPLRLSLAELRAAPASTQITRHDCVEGWNCIGKWTGARLGPLLQQAGLKPGARYIVFHCADEWYGPPGSGTPYTKASTWSTPSTPRPSWPTR